ncbi:MAG: alpha/beta hydrolase [Ruminococcaceae bacterium]|nr:alpha/beta hydrolase [Oscillospiraceae bacterium]
MDKKIYYRGLVAQPWYNFTESLAYLITGRPIPENVLYERKVSYGKEKSQFMNTLCLKELKDKKKPVFIYIHGGGWISGITDMRNTYIVNWVNKGFQAFSLNYTYAPQKVFPAQLQEIYSAIDYIFDNAEKYNIDTDNIVLGGESAGGYFIAYLGACASDSSPLEKLGITFRNKDKFTVKAIVSHSGCYNLEYLSDSSKPQSNFPDMKAMVEAFTGMKKNELNTYIKTPEGKLLNPQVNKDFPPCFLAWSTNDYLRFDTKDFANELRRYNIPYRMFKGDGIVSFHAWTIVTMLKKGRECLQETFDFVLPLLPDYFS